MTEPGKYLVDFEVLETSTLVVGIYEESTNKMVASESVTVTYEELNTVVEFDKSVIPQYYYIRAYLVDPVTMRPRCTMYECPTYTKEMQEFLTKDVDDFDSDLILNLDEDKTNNFAVYKKGTVLGSDENGKNTVVSVDDTNYIYVIDNADDTVKSLANGDVYSQEYGDGQILIVKVSSVDVSGNRVTVYGQESEMEDVFDYVKIDTSSGIEDADVDDSEMTDGVTYNGISNGKEKGISAIAFEDEGKTSATLSFSLSVDEEAKGEHIKGRVSLKGSLDFKAEASVKLYISLSYQYFEFKIDYSAELKAELSASGQVTLNIATVSFSPIPGLYIELKPSIIIKAEIKISLSGKLEGTVGFKLSSDTGNQNLTSHPKFKPEIKVEGTIFVGLSLEPRIVILSDKIAKLGLKGTFGVELKASMKAELQSDKKHDCFEGSEGCISGDISAKLNVSIEAGLFDWDFLSIKINIVDNTIKIADFHYSCKYHEFAFTKCPHIQYKVTVNVRDNELKKVEGAIVTDSEGNTYTTDANGKAEIFLHSGSYGISAQKENSGAARMMFRVPDEPVEITLYLKPNETADTGFGNMIKYITNGYCNSAAITLNGDLYVWGINLNCSVDGKIYESSSIPIKIMSDVANVSLGHSHGAAVKTNGDLYIWGYNAYGQLGDGNGGGFTNYNYVPQKLMSNVASVDLGMWHSSAITTNGDLYLWGDNSYGAIGNGESSDQYKPVKIMSDVVSASLGDGTSSAIKSNGDLYVWGFCEGWKLFNGNSKTYIYSPEKMMSNIASVCLGYDYCGAITKNGDLYTWTNDYFGSTPEKLMSNVASVSFGHYHRSAVTVNGDLYSWGSNTHGQVGDNTTLDKRVPVKVLSNVLIPGGGSQFSIAITNDGSLYGWGWNVNGTLGDPSLGYSGSKIPVKIPFPPKTSTVSLALDTPIMPVPDMTEPTIEPETEFISDTEIAPEQTEPMTIAETTDPNIVTDHTQAPAPTPDVYPETNQRFTGMLKNEVYYCYGMKSRTAEDPFNSDNLLFIAQAISDGNGNLNFTYAPIENYPNAEVFVKAMTDFEVTNAEITNISESNGIVTAVWKAVPNASKYTVYKVMNGVYIKAGETSGTSCTVNDITPNYAYKLVITSCVNGEWSVPSDENAVYFMLTAEPEDDFLLGDLDGNSKLGMPDLTLLAYRVSDPGSAYTEVGDMNEDGKISMEDLTLLSYKISSGK